MQPMITFAAFSFDIGCVIVAEGLDGVVLYESNQFPFPWLLIFQAP
jgi:hypothetical protein